MTPVSRCCVLILVSWWVVQITPGGGQSSQGSPLRVTAVKRVVRFFRNIKACTLPPFPSSYWTFLSEGVSDDEDNDDDGGGDDDDDGGDNNYGCDDDDVDENDNGMMV